MNWVNSCNGYGREDSIINIDIGIKVMTMMTFIIIIIIIMSWCRFYNVDAVCYLVKSVYAADRFVHSAAVQHDVDHQAAAMWALSRL